MSTGDDVRTLADELHLFVLDENPFAASMLGLRGYDDRVPDVSVAAEIDAAVRLAGFVERAGSIDPTGLDAADAVTLVCVTATAGGILAALRARSIEYTVSATFGDGPGAILGLASQTRVTDAEAGRNWLARVTGLTGYLEGVLERLRAGSAAGRTPVATLVRTAIAQLDELLATDAPGPLAAPLAAAAGGTGEQPDWVDELLAALTAEVGTRLWPALATYRDALRDELLPTARPDDKAGLVHLAGGAESYAALVRVHTTLDLTAEQIHQQGLADIESDHRRLLEIGQRHYGVSSLAEVLAALHAAGADPDPQEAMARARTAVGRAEVLAPSWFPPPAAPPCAVEPMAPLLAKAGMAPHYTPPSQDGSRVGTYWFNADRPGLGTGPELESVTYHEAVPGHHLQLVRMLGLTDIPALQRQTIVTAHAEGWGLYAEALAEEMGLYTDDEALMGMLVTDVFRAGRLVVDTGLHALGWSRQQAITFFADAVPLPLDSLTAEVDRYIGMPGQALAYKTGQREILRLRAEARQTLGELFDIRGFHAAVLDSGGVPLPALATAVHTWIDRVQAVS